ncbi:MAG: hypothetical protein IPO86_16330 [Saprospiraceae bacterium]|nr:hypothetical protein [Saprospiraceae bacterium]
MTEKQIERVRNKIDKYRKALAADKKLWGGFYHDGQGIRYVIPGQFLKIKDYKGCFRYFNWFKKNFPDDSCDPIILFEWTFTLYKCGKLVDAEKNAHRTFFSNPYLFDKFLAKEPLHLNNNESSSWELESLVQYFSYTNKDTEFSDFGEWVETILQSRIFLDKVNEFVELERQLKIEPVGKRRTEIVNRLSRLKYE